MKNNKKCIHNDSISIRYFFETWCEEIIKNEVSEIQMDEIPYFGYIKRVEAYCSNCEKQWNASSFEKLPKYIQSIKNEATGTFLEDIGC